MAYSQNKSNNLTTEGGSPYNNYQALKNDSQYQNQLIMELKQFIIETIDSKLRQFETVIRREIKDMVCDVDGSLQGKTNKLQNDLLIATDGLSDAIIGTAKNMDIMKAEFRSGNKILDQKIYNVQNKLQELENQILLTETKLMESAIRLRGIVESDKDLRKVCVDSFAEILKIKPDEISCKIEQVYRVNSHVATTKKLPRDVVVHFTEKNLRNIILQKSFATVPQIAGKKIQVFKELPSKVLLQRKRFGFLVNELRKEHILFRWNLPVGIIFWFQGKRYQLNTVEEAEEFYKNMFLAVSKPITIIEDQDIKQLSKQDFVPPTIQEEGHLKEIQKEERGVTQQKLEEQQGGSKQAKNKRWKRLHNSKKRHF